MLGVITCGPLEEKDAMNGALAILMALDFCIIATDIL